MTSIDEVRLKAARKPQSRLAVMKSGDIDEEERTCCVSFSSETPVKRWYGNEILSHKKGAMDLERMNKKGAFLLNHDPDKQIGCVLEAHVDEENKKGLAVVKFSRNRLGEEAFQDLKDGILENVSFRYVFEPEDIELMEKGGKGELSSYRVNNYEVLELSLVGIPADHSVGVGRSFEEVNREPEQIKKPKEESAMGETATGATVSSGAENKGAGAMSHEELMREERDRTAQIMALAEEHDMRELGQKFVADGRSINDFGLAILKEKKNELKPQSSAEGIGLRENEARNFSFVNAIRAAANNNWRGAEFEKEVIDAVREKTPGADGNTLYIPVDVLRAGNDGMGATFEGQGKELVATSLRTDSFIEMLRNKLVVKQMGARVLSGLRDNLSIPRQAAGSTAQWVDETVAVPESRLGLDQINMGPKIGRAHV